MSHGPIEPPVREAMTGIAKAIAGSLPPGYGFTLLVFQFDPAGGRMNYISNATRADMLVAMKEFIAKNEGRAPDIEGHA